MVIGNIWKDLTNASLFFTAFDEKRTGFNYTFNDDKERGKLIEFTINIGLKNIKKQDYFYLFKNTNLKFIYLLTRHPPSVVIAHELGHLLQFLEFYKLYDKSNLNNFDDDFNNYIKNQYTQVFDSIYLFIEKKLKKIDSNFKIIDNSLAETEIRNQIDSIYDKQQNNFTLVMKENAISDELCNKLLFLINILEFDEFSKQITSIFNKKHNYAQDIIKEGRKILGIRQIQLIISSISSIY